MSAIEYLVDWEPAANYFCTLNADGTRDMECELKVAHCFILVLIWICLSTIAIILAALSQTTNNAWNKRRTSRILCRLCGREQEVDPDLEKCSSSETEMLLEMTVEDLV
jgi:hypothetical protein